MEDVGHSKVSVTHQVDPALTFSAKTRLKIKIVPVPYHSTDPG